MKRLGPGQGSQKGLMCLSGSGFYMVTKQGAVAAASGELAVHSSGIS